MAWTVLEQALDELKASNPEASLAEIVAMLPPEGRAAWLSQLSPEQQAALRWHWPFWRRPKQWPAPTLPNGESWRFWFIRSGRGFGKNKTAAEWLIDRIRRGIAGQIALVARTAADVRDTIVEVGVTSIMKLSPPDFVPDYEPSKRRLTWPNGAVATAFSSEEPDLARGPQHDTVLGDEIASWSPGAPIAKVGSSGNETFDNLNLGLRLPARDGSPPQAVLTGTPKPTALVRWLSKHPATLLTRGSTYENRANLAPEFLKEIIASYKGTSLELQELFGELLEELEGALWRRSMFRRAARTAFDRIVVSVDPSASANGHEAGIIVAGRLALTDMEIHNALRSSGALQRKAMVLADLSCGGGPRAWAGKAVAAYQMFKANAIVAERNHGGDMVKMVIEQAAGREPIKVEELVATTGKRSRAEPVVLLYEQGRVLHDADVNLDELETQCTTWVPDGGKPNDRIDALVWAVWDLILKGRQYASFALPGLDPSAGLQENPFDF